MKPVWVVRYRNHGIIAYSQSARDLAHILSPATIPFPVEDLSNLPTGPIRKICSGGYITAALTKGDDLYIWGGRPGERAILEGLSGVPMPVDIAGEDVSDVGVGMNHIMVLTTENKVFVIGNGENGQLGLDVKKLDEWTEIHLPLVEGQRVVSVCAGYKNSFVLVETVDS
jgi:alpha-tubulin suppressor-like RCC1 family protein